MVTHVNGWDVASLYGGDCGFDGGGVIGWREGVSYFLERKGGISGAIGGISVLRWDGGLSGKACDNSVCRRMACDSILLIFVQDFFFIKYICFLNLLVPLTAIRPID
jgi:hypothetical protein